MLLEAVHRVDQLLEGVRQPLLHLHERLGRADSRDDVLALGVREELPVEALLAGRRVTRERDAGPRLRALVAEDHLDDVDRGAEVVRDPVSAPVDLRPRRVPRVEDRPDRAAELPARLLRERLADLVGVDPLERADELLEVVGVELDVLVHVALALELGERVLEALRVDALDHLAVHLDQPPVGVVREARVLRGGRETLDRLVVQAEVEDRVHHPGHRDRGPGADRHEQRVVGVAEALARLLLQRAQMLLDLGLEAVGHRLAVLHVRARGVGRDREARRDRHSELRHLREPDALAPQELASALGRLVEVVDKALGHRREYSHSHTETHDARLTPA